MVKEGDLLWTPGKAFVEASPMSAFLRWLKAERGLTFADQAALWRWSVSDLEGFWSAVWDHFGVHSVTPYGRVLDGRAMPGAKWFEGARVNHAEHLLRHEAKAPDAVAMHHLSELRPLARLTWRELGGMVRRLATSLRELGVGPGDRVVSFMPNIPETAIAMMATTAIGAVWSSAAPEFGLNTVIDRFRQIEPKLLFAADGYRFGGRDFERAEEVDAIVSRLPSVERVVWLPYLHADGAPPAGLPSTSLFAELLAGPEVPADTFAYEYVEWNHPLWILFSSGTTGLPKPIVHGHAGMIVEQMKATALHTGLGPESCMFFYSTTGWMMWNALLGALIRGAAVVLYDGHPAHPRPDLLWRIAEAAGATCFGASPTYVQNMQKLNLVPRESFDLSRLTTILLSGSPASPECFAWFYENVKTDLWMTSQSGGTELCSGLVGASPLLPVRAGEIQTRLLGMDVHAWNDEGKEVVGEVGELVVTSPSPSMPLYFWNDPDGKRYRESYFDTFPGVWRHGDFIRINADGGCHIHGRSDSTLNRYGVRIGTAEVYRAVERVPEVADSLIVCLDLSGGRFFMPLFVRLKEGLVLDEALAAKIAATLREDASPRHVPDRIYQVPSIPCTLTGKKMEVPVRRILMGWAPEKAASRDAMMDPAALEWFVRFAAESRDWRR